MSKRPAAKAANIELGGEWASLARTVAKAGGIVLLAKNGIGFGHITRCLLLARELRQLAPDVGVTLVSQAGSLLAHAGADVPIINFPLLHRLPSGAIEHTHTALLDAVLEELAPLLVVEDTYPDPQYQRVLSIRECRRVLVQRRIDCMSFERFRRDRAFGPYDRVLLTQTPAEFDEEGHTLASRLLVENSDRFRLVGPVYRTPTREDLSQAAARYAADGSPLVVVNAGAGGDHFNDAYCERLFTTLSQVAQRCHSENVPAAFAFVLGPYFGGRLQPPPPNVTVVRYEPLLHALLNQARIVVARPGHNVTHETLAGPASVLLVPGVSWMETQHEHSQRLARLPGIFVGDVDDPIGIYDLMREALNAPSPSEPRVVAPANRAVALALLKELGTALAAPSAVNGEVFLLVRGAGTPERAVAIRDHLAGATVLSDDGVIALSAFLRSAPSGDRAVFADVAPSPTLMPEDLRRTGVVALVFSDHGAIGASTREWVDHHHGLIPEGLVPIELYRMRANPERPRDVAIRVGRLLRRTPIAAVDLDVSMVSDDELGAYAKAVGGDLGAHTVRLAHIEELVREHLSWHVGGT